MIRVLIYLVIVALLAFGAVWLAERPGDVVITWQGERVETSVMVLMAAAAAVAVAAVLAVVDRARHRGLARRGLALPAQSPRRARLPGGVARADRGRLRRCARGEKFTAEARRIAPDEPLTLLLSAQAAQLAGNRDAAAATFQQMAERDDTKVLGLHGLFVEAQRRNDPPPAVLCRGGRQGDRRSRPGPGRRCWNSAASPATGAPRWCGSSAT
jgi:HemY protein